MTQLKSKSIKPADYGYTLAPGLTNLWGIIDVPENFDVLPTTERALIGDFVHNPGHATYDASGAKVVGGFYISPMFAEIDIAKWKDTAIYLRLRQSGVETPEPVADEECFGDAPTGRTWSCGHLRNRESHCVVCMAVRGHRISS